MNRPLHKQIRVHTNQGVRWLIFDSGETRNGLTPAIVDYLADLLRQASHLEEVRAVVLGGAHGVFCSGANLAELRRRPEAAWDDELERFHALIRVLWEIDKPTIAALDGGAAGFGASLALACDLRLGSERASFAWDLIRLGLMPDGGSTWLLPRIIGEARARECLLTGNKVRAPEALQVGLLNEVVEGDAFAGAVQKTAARLAAGPPLAVAQIKQALRSGQKGFYTALDSEAAGQEQLLKTEDFFEGLAASLRKDSPLFSGR